MVGVGQCQGRSTQELVTGQERVSGGDQGWDSWGLASLSWRDGERGPEPLTPCSPPPVSSRCAAQFSAAWALGGALHPVLRVSGPLLGKVAGAWRGPPKESQRGRIPRPQL